MNEDDFDRSYIAPHLQKRVRQWEEVSVGERLTLTFELSQAAWEKIGVVRDPDTPMDKTIRRIKPER